MPYLNYKNSKVLVENDETTLGDEISEIPLERLFVSSPNIKGLRYAFDINEIENYFKTEGNLTNFYSSPKQNFSLDDISTLCARSEIITNLIEEYIISHENAKLISDETKREMEKFHVVVRNQNPHEIPKPILAQINELYSSEELETLAKTGTTLVDLSRGIAFAEFKAYYFKLNKIEQQAIDTLPGISYENFFENYEGAHSLAQIFELKGNSCLGGTAGICAEIVRKLDFLQELKQMHSQSIIANEEQHTPANIYLTAQINNLVSISTGQNLKKDKEILIEIRDAINRIDKMKIPQHAKAVEMLGIIEKSFLKAKNKYTNGIFGIFYKHSDSEYSHHLQKPKYKLSYDRMLLDTLNKFYSDYPEINTNQSIKVQYLITSPTVEKKKSVTKP